jgi:hypothetical protein
MHAYLEYSINECGGMRVPEFQRDHVVIAYFPLDNILVVSYFTGIVAHTGGIQVSVRVRGQDSTLKENCGQFRLE